MVSTQFMPTKKTWDTITDKLQEVEITDTNSISERHKIYVNPPSPYKIERKDNEPPEILC